MNQNATESQIAEARDWAADCMGMSAGVTPSAERAMAYVEAEYDGGWAAFVAECREGEMPIQAHEVTGAMLAQARKAADVSWLAQTIWPSRWYGPNYLSRACLVICAAAVSSQRPADAAAGAEPLMSVLPTDYLEGQVAAKELHELSQCGPYCSFEERNQYAS